MSITDELRDCIRTANRSYEDARNPYNDREILHIPEEELLAIADRIERMHQESLEEQGERHRVKMHDAICKAHADGERSAMKQNRSCSQDYMHGKADAIEEVEREYVKLPADADGVPIHVGDTVEEVGEDPTRYTVCGVGTLQDRPAVFYGNPSEYGYADGWDFAENVCHVQPDSWERIIEDAIKNVMYDHDNERIQQKLVERCKRLAGEA